MAAKEDPYPARDAQPLAQELCGSSLNPEFGELLKELGEGIPAFWRGATSALSGQLGCGGEEGSLV
jgi:hypothetical protein